MAKLYLKIIFFSECFLIALNVILALTVFHESVWNIVTAVLSSTALVILIDTFFAIFIGILPKKMFNANRKIFIVSKKEQIFYEKLSIRKWKDKIWELGGLGGFSKSKIKDPQNPKYYERFIIESNRGVVEHLLGAFFGFLICLEISKHMFSIAIPIAVINLVLNILPTMVLRYNMPKLRAVYFGLTKRQKENEEQQNLGVKIEQEE